MSITITYDEPSDTLRFDVCKAYVGQDEDEIRPGIVARFNPSGGWIENVEVMYFLARMDVGTAIELPIDVEFHLDSHI